MPKFYAISLETPFYADNRFSAYLLYRDACHELLQWLTDYDAQIAYDVLTLQHGANYDNTVKIGNNTFKFTFGYYQDDDHVKLSDTVVDSLVETTNALCERVIEHKQERLDAYDEISEYKSILLDDLATWLPKQINTVFNDVLTHYGITLSDSLTDYLLKYHAETITSCHYVDGFYASGNRHYVHSISITDMVTQLPVSVSKSLSEKLNYFVDDDYVSMGVIGYYELRLNAYQVMKLVADDML